MEKQAQQSTNKMVSTHFLPLPSTMSKTAIKLTGLPASFLLCNFHPVDALLRGNFSSFFESLTCIGSSIEPMRCIRIGM